MHRVRLLMVSLVFTMLGAPAAQADTHSIVLPRGTTVQKLGAGHFRFTLPDGRKVEVRGLDARTGAIIGDSGVYDATGKKTITGKRGSLRGAGRPGREQSVRPATTEYVKIDDEVTWLPATVRIEAAAAVRLSPPGGRRTINPQPEPPKGKGVIDPDPPYRPGL